MPNPAQPFVDIAAGTVVFREGEPAQAMFIIESGSIGLALAARGPEPFARLGPGEFFGEEGLFDAQSRHCSATATAAGRLLRVERDEFVALVGQQPAIALSLVQRLSERHWRSEQRLSAELGGVRRPDPVTAAALSVGPPVPPKASTPPPAPSPAPAPAAPAPPPVTGSGGVLKHASGWRCALDPARADFLVGRPDPAAGIQPEIDLSPLDATRTLSRRHARLVREGRLLLVREDGATVNGTYVNGSRLQPGVGVPIKPGDILRFGAVEIEFAAV